MYTVILSTKSKIRDLKKYIKNLTEQKKKKETVDVLKYLDNEKKN